MDFKKGNKVWWGATLSPSALFLIVEDSAKRNKKDVFKSTRIDGQFGDRSEEERTYIYPEAKSLVPYNENQTVIKWPRDGQMWVKLNGEWRHYAKLGRGGKRLLNRAQLRAIKNCS